MEVHRPEIDGLLVLTPRLIEDARGSFSEVYSVEAMAAAGVAAVFVQDNHSVSTRAGTVRGLHFQAPPAAQGKLIRVARGRARDVAVDLRVGSPTYGRHASIELSADNRVQLWVPPGFAHGFATLEDGTEVLYKCTAAYEPAAEGGLAFDDPALGIDWGVDPADAVTSDRDRHWPKLAGLASPFTAEPARA